METAPENYPFVTPGEYLELLEALRLILGERGVAARCCRAEPVFGTAAASEAPAEPADVYLEFEIDCYTDGERLLPAQVHDQSRDKDEEDVYLISDDDEPDPESLPPQPSITSTPSTPPPGIYPGTASQIYTISVVYSRIQSLPVIFFRESYPPQLSQARLGTEDGGSAATVLTLPTSESWALSVHPLTGVANWYTIHGCRVDQVMKEMRSLVLPAVVEEGFRPGRLDWQKRWVGCWLGGLGVRWNHSTASTNSTRNKPAVIHHTS